MQQSDDFDMAETVAGYPLVKIKHALSTVGLLDDRNDVAIVADSLGCSRPKAARVLGSLQLRGFVTPGEKKNQWRLTALGRRLAYQWRPPPKLEPATALADVDGATISEVLGAVRCSVLRAQGDDDAFEEAEIHVGICVAFASPRVLEVSVEIPDDLENPDSGSTSETIAYLGLTEAKRLTRMLQRAIRRGEAEIARRRQLKPQRPSRKTARPTPSA